MRATRDTAAPVIHPWPRIVQLAQLVGALLKRGPWQLAQQLPATFVPQLTVRALQHT